VIGQRRGGEARGRSRHVRETGGEESLGHVTILRYTKGACKGITVRRNCGEEEKRWLIEFLWESAAGAKGKNGEKVSACIMKEEEGTVYREGRMGVNSSD